MITLGNASIPVLTGTGYNTPYATAKRRWEAEMSPRPFEHARDDILLTGGYCYVSPEIFILGKPVYVPGLRVSIEDEKRILDMRGIEKNQNCWHIWLCAGDLRRCFDMLPFKLEYVSWERTDGFRVYNFNRIYQIIKQ